MGQGLQIRELESSRLDSWKEIASFLHRDARTVRRWERERQLPVHRVPGGERSGVFAYVNELESWLHAAGSAAKVAAEDKPAPALGKLAVIEAGSASKYKAEDAKEGVESAEPAERPVLMKQPVTPLSAFQSLNNFETNFAADALAEDEDLAGVAGGPARVEASSFRRRYHAVSFLLILMVALGISAAVVHYRGARQGKTVAHHPNPEAQELYLRGRYYWNLRTEEGLTLAVDLFTQSIVNDPHYAEAYAGLADAYLLLRQYGHMPNSEAFPRALAAAKQAIALDDASPDAHRSIAFILRFWNWDMATAEKEYLRAIELNPNDSLSHHWYATALLSSNRYREALAEIDTARRLEPQSVAVLADRGLILSMTDGHAGMAALKQVEDAEPGFLSTHIYLAETYLQMADYKNFLAESKVAAELTHNAAMVAVLESAQRTLITRGARPMLRQIAADFAPLADRGATPAYGTARLFALAGNSERSIEYLRLACDHREPGFLNVEDDQAFDLLRSSGEYNLLIARKDVPYGGSQPVARLAAPDLSE